MRYLSLSFGAALVALVLSASTAHAALFKYVAYLDGPSESPPNASPGIGSAFVDYDDVAQTLRVRAQFSGLIGTTTAAHIHGPTATPLQLTAGVITTTPTFPGFPLGVTSGTMDQTYDLTLAGSWNPSFVTAQGSIAAAETALANALAQGRSYFNIHSTFAAGGEIRGFLVPVPEPATASLLALGAAGSMRRRRRS